MRTLRTFGLVLVLMVLAISRMAIWPDAEHSTRQSNSAIQTSEGKQAPAVSTKPEGQTLRAITRSVRSTHTLIQITHDHDPVWTPAKPSQAGATCDNATTWIVSGNYYLAGANVGTYVRIGFADPGCVRFTLENATIGTLGAMSNCEVAYSKVSDGTYVVTGDRRPADGVIDAGCLGGEISMYIKAIDQSKFFGVAGHLVGVPYFVSPDVRFLYDYTRIPILPGLVCAAFEVTGNWVVTSIVPAAAGNTEWYDLGGGAYQVCQTDSLHDLGAHVSFRLERTGEGGYSIRQY